MLQKWIKKGLIYNVSGGNYFDFSHCHKPTPLLLNEDVIRIYFGTRDKQGKTRTTFVDVSAENPSKILYIHNKPVLDLGKIGAFDDSGANVSSVIRVGNLIYMYFIGWNPSTTVHTRNSIGLAISEDGGWSFQRAYDGAILDRTKDEPYYTGAVHVMKDKDEFKIWYTSGSEWKIIDDKPEIFYHIKYGFSKNGIDWERNDVTCIPPSHSFEATARPSVIFDGNKYSMWYSRRDLRSFRIDPRQGYRAGYAESHDGIHWNRLDNMLELDVSQDINSWDSNAIAYPYVIESKKGKIMFYNGNGFGKTGFGWAFLNEIKNTYR